MAADRARPAQNSGESEMLTGWLEHHRAIRASGWSGRVLTTFRPDDVVDAEFEDKETTVRTN